MRTQVSVYLHGACNHYYFPYDYKRFMTLFNSSIAAVGYFEMVDEKGKFIIINPSQCSAIEVLGLE